MTDPVTIDVPVTVSIVIPGTVVEMVCKSISENFPEASSGCTLLCVGWKYDAWRFTFVDTEDADKKYVTTREMWLKAFPLLFTDKWPKGCTKPLASADPDQWGDWLCQADATDFDAFAQLVCLGEVIYG